MEDLEDLLSETDGEGHLNLPSGQFSFAAIRRHLGKAQAPPGSGDKDEYIDWDPQLTKGLWDISALGLQDYRHADDLEEEEEEEEEEEPDEDADAEDQEAESYADLHFRRGPARTEEFRDGSSTGSGRGSPRYEDEEDLHLEPKRVSLPRDTRGRSAGSGGSPSAREAYAEEDYEDPEDEPEASPETRNSSERRGLSEDELCAHSALVGPQSSSPSPSSPPKKQASVDQPIAASGSYKAPPASGASEASTALPEDAGAPTKKPFLRKGARAKSTLPGNTGPLATRPPAPKKRAISEPRSESHDAQPDKFDSMWGSMSSVPSGPGPKPSERSAAAKTGGAVAKSQAPKALEVEETSYAKAGQARPRKSAAGPIQDLRADPELDLEEAEGTSYAKAAQARPSKSAAGPIQDLRADPELDLEEDWNDALPWDCRGKEDLLDELEEEEDLDGEPPTSDIVRSYFHRPAPASSRVPASRPSPHWEGSDAFSALYGRSPGEGSLAGAQAEGRRKAGRKSQGPETSRAERERAERRERPDDEAAAEAKARLTALDEELKKYEKENETLKKLQASARNAERDIAREREKLWKEVEAERTALHAEFDVERAALRKERRRLAEAADRQRQQLKEEKEAQEERQRLQEKADQLEEEMKEKEKRWQRTVDRLQRQVTEFTKKNSELQEEVKRLNQQAAQAQQSSWLKEVAAAKRGLSANRKRSGSVGPAVTNTVSSGSSNAAGRMESVASAASAPIGGASGTSGAPPPSTALRGTETARPRAASATPKVSATEEVRETRRLDGRVERIFGDGRREVEFSNGLKKVMWPDGQTSVMFQNGDLKEIREDGVVVYHYRATGAVQTTLTDGTELYQFNDGQTERHCLDGSKEIRFPNGTTKKIFDDGSEEVCFADGTMKRTSAK
ncbi:unnamed protein product [Effrenium voratum]|uniref:Centromere protein J C-terminal domain-containing protein n=1 Tax=Effrenium voratum TaxID=2562239 RepID=A0AA36HP93_9DINO|nr:unnamed protein product [Effrenium voratum]